MPPRISSAFRATAILTLVAIVVVILYESSQARGRPGVLDLTTNEAYLGHFAVYAALAFCGLAALGRPTWLGVIAVVTVSIGLGWALELYQVQVPTRTASVQDAMADTAGVLAGLFAYAVAAMLLEPYEKQARKL